MSIRFAVALSLAVLAAIPAVPQPSPEVQAKQMAEAAKGGPIPKYVKDETPEQRRERLGTATDPGLDPDPEQVWWRFGHAYKIEKYDRQWAAYDQPLGFVRPMAMANFGFEIYQQNDKHVWVWMPQAPEPGSANAIVNDAAAKSSPFTEPQLGFLRMIAAEYEPLSVPAATKKIRFEEASAGLPDTGSWRNSMAVADMNGDGFPDIIAPPERGGTGTLPAIYLGDGKGNWKGWSTVIWPYEIQYGSVAAADFNGDKKMDLVFGIHLIGVRVFLGDGKGNFKDGSLGMEATDFTTRRVTTADIDQDGDTDIVALFEGPAPMRENSKKFEGGKLRIYRNDGKAGKWTILDASAPADYVGGDWLAVGKFNDDRYPDFVGSSNFYQATDVLYRSTGAGKWAKVDSREGQLIPFLSLYNAVTAARLSSKKLDDAVLSFQRTWPDAVDASVIRKPSLSFVVGLDRVAFDGSTPKRVPIVRYDSKRPITGLAAGDFDGDGKRDLIFTKFDPREFIVLLGDGKGNFGQAELEGLTAANNANYDITVADVNKDGRPDVLVMYESSAASSLGRQDGSIRVFLNRGVAPAGPQTADAKK